MEFVQKLLKIDSNLVFGEGEFGVTDILYAAARSKYSEVFRVLLEVSGSRKEMDGKSDEKSLVFRREMMNRAVHAAARGGNVEMLREIIGDNLADVLGYRDAQGCTVLHSASSRGQVEVVKDLIATSDIITSTDNQGNMAVHVAAYHGHLPVVKVLIAFSPSIAAMTNDYGDTLLHMVVAGFCTPGFRRVDRQIELIKEVVSGKLVDIENIVNIQNNNGRTALHMAVSMNTKSEVVELLMTVFGINLNIRDNNGMTPLDLLKQGPKSASSEILIKRLISAGGISNCEDHVTRNALVSHLKMTGIGGSPGTSFRVPDSEIFLYAGIENEINSTDSYIESPDYSAYSGELSRYNSPDISNSFGIKKPSSADNAKMRLKRLFRWPRRERKDESGSSIDDDKSLKSYGSGKGSEASPISLRERFTKHMSLPNGKRVTPARYSLPSPSTKKKFSARLMHGVIQAVPNLPYKSPASPLSDSSRASPISSGDQKGIAFGREKEESPMSNLSFSVEKLSVIRENASFDKKLMNRYLCVGSHGLALEDPVGHDHAHQNYDHSSTLMT